MKEQLKRAIRSHKFTREEFPIPCVLPREICDQIDELIEASAPTPAPPTPPREPLVEQLWAQLKKIATQDGDECYFHLYDSFRQAQAKMSGSAYDPAKLKIKLDFAQITQLIHTCAPTPAPEPSAEWFTALLEWKQLRDEVTDLEAEDCSCEPDNFHRCERCADVAVRELRMRSLMARWSDTWALKLLAAPSAPPTGKARWEADCI